MSSPAPARSRLAPVATIVLALLAVGLTGFAVLDRNWYVSDSDEGAFSIGLVAAQMCLGESCREAPVSAFDSTADAPRLGAAVLLAAVLAGLLLFAATARMLIGARRFGWLPRLALIAAVFAGALAAAWLILSPWSETMVPGTAAIVFFVGTGLAAATAAIPLGALRRHSVL